MIPKKGSLSRKQSKIIAHCKGALIGKGALINKNALEGGGGVPIREGHFLARGRYIESFNLLGHA